MAIPEVRGLYFQYIIWFRRAIGYFKSILFSVYENPQKCQAIFYNSTSRPLSRIRNSWLFPELVQRCTKPPNSRNKSGISGRSGLWAQKSGTVSKVRNIVVSAWKKSGMDRNRSKMSQNHVFHFNLGVNRLFAPFCLSRSRSVKWWIYLQKGMAAEFLITQFTHVTVYVYLVKYDVLFYAYGFPSCVSLF